MSEEKSETPARSVFDRPSQHLRDRENHETPTDDRDPIGQQSRTPQNK